MSAAAETQSGNWSQKTPFGHHHPGGRVPERGEESIYSKKRQCKGNVNSKTNDLETGEKDDCKTGRNAVSPSLPRGIMQNKAPSRIKTSEHTQYYVLFTVTSNPTHTPVSLWAFTPGESSQPSLDGTVLAPKPREVCTQGPGLAFTKTPH